MNNLCSHTRHSGGPGRQLRKCERGCGGVRQVRSVRSNRFDCFRCTIFHPRERHDVMIERLCTVSGTPGSKAIEGSTNILETHLTPFASVFSLSLFCSPCSLSRCAFERCSEVHNCPTALSMDSNREKGSKYGYDKSNL